MKEFAQKHSVVLFWSTVILLIISITLSICTFCGRGYMGRGFKGNERGQMMQYGEPTVNYYGSRGPRNNVSKDQNVPETNVSAPVAPVKTGTVTQ